MKRLAWTLILALTACDAPSAPAPAEPPAPRGPEANDREPRWSIEAPSGALSYGVGTGRPMVTLRCSGVAFQVSVSGFVRIDSEDRLTLGAGDEAFAFAADLESTGPGVVANGAIPPDLLDRIERGETISAVYGAQGLNPIAGAPQALARDFVSGCRSLLRPS